VLDHPGSRPFGGPRAQLRKTSDNRHGKALPNVRHVAFGEIGNTRTAGVPRRHLARTTPAGHRGRRRSDRAL